MPQMILEYVLKNKNIVIGKDVEIVTNLQFTSTAGAFIGGVGDYTAEFDPSASAIEAEGKGYVVAAVGQETGKVPYTVYMATKDYISKNPSVIQKFTNAIYKGQLWVKNHTAKEVAEVVAPHFKESDLASLEKMIQRYSDSDVWTFNPTFDEAAFNLIQDIMENGGQLEKRVPFSALVDNKYAKDAIKNVK